MCSGGSPIRPASPSLGSGPAQTGGRRKSRSAPARTRPPYPARHGAQSQHAPHRLRVADPAFADKMETASSPAFLCLFTVWQALPAQKHPPLGLASLPRRRGRSDGGDASVVRLRQASWSRCLFSGASWLLWWKWVYGLAEPACLAE